MDLGSPVSHHGRPGGTHPRGLRTVARFADVWNVFLVSPEEAAAKDAVLRRWCDEVGRDPDEIERSLSLGPMVIRDDPTGARALVGRFKESNPGMEREVLTGSVDEITELCGRYADVGFRHFIFHSPAPYDEETLERFASEVRPNLD